MRLLLRAFVLGPLLALPLGPPVWGAMYFDSTGENFDGFAHMDIASVEVTDNGTDITFKITLSGSLASPNDWGKYVIGIDTNPATGDFGAPVGNPWGRNINMADGMDAWIGSWADSGGGFQAWTYSSGSWNLNHSGTPVLSGNMTTITTSLASLGLSQNQTIQFDVYTTGGFGGDSANDAAANPNQTTTGWSGPYTTPSGRGLFYTTTPEPASVMLVGLAMVGLLGYGRRRR